MCQLLLFILILLGISGYALFDWPGAIAGCLVTVLTIGFIEKSHRVYHYILAGHPMRWLRAKLGWGLSVAQLAKRLGKSVEELRNFEPKFREVFIPKKNGTKRRLLVPDDSTKALQRLLLKRLLRKLRLHCAAYGFIRGRSPVQHAQLHVGQAVVITMDIIDFFPSTKAERVEYYFRRIGWNSEAAKLLTHLTTCDGGLPQGAPTSPSLSNLVNFYLDAQITKAVARQKGTYSRYADDLTISYPLDYPKTNRGIVEKVKRLLKSKGYRVHTLHKLRVRRQHQRQYVTGLVVNAKVQMPRETRRWLRAIKHRNASGRAPTLSPEQLQGWIAYENGIAIQAENATERTNQLKKNRGRIQRRKAKHQSKLRERKGKSE